MLPGALKVFRRDIAPSLITGSVLGLLIGLIFGSALDGFSIGSTIGAMLPSVSERGYRFAFSLSIGITYGVMFHNVNLGIIIANAIPAALELIALRQRRA